MMTDLLTITDPLYMAFVSGYAAALMSAFPVAMLWLLGTGGSR